jgi:hypothetical protein
MNIGHAGVDVAPELKLVPAFVDFDRARFTRPIVHVLKQMAVNGTQMSKIKCPDGCAFRDSVSH